MGFAHSFTYPLSPPVSRPHRKPRVPQTMKEFWFFNFSSSLICCLKNSILSRKRAKLVNSCNNGRHMHTQCYTRKKCTSARATWPGSRTLAPVSAGSSALCSSLTCRCCPWCEPLRVTARPGWESRMGIVSNATKILIFLDQDRWLSMFCLFPLIHGSDVL